MIKDWVELFAAMEDELFWAEATVKQREILLALLTDGEYRRRAVAVRWGQSTRYGTTGHF